jgi:hypothetical protein
VRALLTRAPLEALALAALAVAVALFACVTSSISELNRFALGLRWGGLAAFVALALLLAAARPGRGRRSGVVAALAASLAGLALVSATWSPYPRLTLERGATFVLALVGAGALAVAATGRPALVRATAAVIVALSAAVAVGGFVLLALDRDQALQGATDDSPVRLQGIGMNPNTASLLYSFTVVLALWLALEARSRGGRLLAGLATVVIGASLFASGSRGATVASFLGIVLFFAARDATVVRRAALVAATVAVYVVGVSSSNFRSLQPEFVTAVKAHPAQTPAAGGPTEQPLPPPRQGKQLAPGVVLADVGPVGTRWRRALPFVRPNFPYDVYQIGFERGPGTFQPAQTGIFRGSGRVQVWKGALDEIEKRPFLGFGFGLEEQVFVDRYYAFEGSRPENAYLGWLLQLGLVGTILFAALGAALVVVGLRRSRSAERAALAGAVLAGFAVSVMQSWVYSVGNLATLPFWVVAGLLVAAAASPDGDGPPRRRVLVTGAAVAAGLALLAVGGRAERAHWLEAQRAGIDDVYRSIGSGFLVRSVSDVYDAVERPGLSCIRYSAGGDPYAMQLCFDGRGRVAEAYDERSGKVEIFDLHTEPAESRLRIDPAQLKQIRRYVVSTQDEIRRAAERERVREALRKARAGRTS